MSAHWGQNITIDGSGDRVGINDPGFVQAYEQGTLAALGAISRNMLGNLLIRLICFNSRRLLIEATEQEVRIDNPGTFADDPSAAQAGRAGSDVHIFYDPAIFNGNAQYVHFRPDDVLFHELVHALRIMRGLIDTTTMIGWDNKEDFFAITLTNIYLSMNNRNADLRGSHSPVWQGLPWDSLNNRTQTDLTFYLLYGNILDDISKAMPDLCLPIVSIPCQWNPIHAGAEYVRKALNAPRPGSLASNMYGERSFRGSRIRA